MGYSARRGFTNGKISGAARQAEMQQKIAEMQAAMTSAQENVEAQEFTASVGGGVVEAKVNGKKEVLSVTIKPEAVDPDDVEMLQDLVVSAVNEALRQAGDAMEKGMESVTGGLNLSAVGLYGEKTSGALAPLVLELENFYEETDMDSGTGLPAAGRLRHPADGTAGGGTGSVRDGDCLCTPG